MSLHPENPPVMWHSSETSTTSVISIGFWPGASFETCKDVGSVHLNFPTRYHRRLPKSPPKSLSRGIAHRSWPLHITVLRLPCAQQTTGVRSVTRPSHLITTYKLRHSNRNGGFLCIFTLNILWWFGKVILFGKYHMPSLKYGFKQQWLWVLLTLLLLPVTCTLRCLCI